MRTPGCFALIALSAFAQEPRVRTGGEGRESTVRLFVNGGWEIGIAHESGRFRESAYRLVRGAGVPAGAREGHTFANGAVHLDVHAVLEGDVGVYVRLQNTRYRSSDRLPPGFRPDVFGPGISEFSRSNLAGGSGDVELELKRAEIRLNDVFARGVTLRLGVQDAVFDVRGRGDAFFLDVSRAESPWGEIGNAWFGPVRKENSALGLHLGIGRFGIGLFQVGDAAHRLLAIPAGDAAEERLAFVTAVFDLDEAGSRAGGIVALMNGTAHGDDVWTIGAAASVRLTGRLEVFGELYAQAGTAIQAGNSELDAAVTGFVPVTDLEARGRAGRIGARLEFPGGSPAWIELAVLYISGFEQDAARMSTGTGDLAGVPANSETREFLSYENNDDMMILDSNEWGFDIDDNILQVKVKGGLSFGGGGPEGTAWTLVGKMAWARAVEKYLVGPGPASEDDYGIELDVTVGYDFNRNADLFLTVARLFNSDLMALFNRGADESMFLVLLGTSGRY